MFVYIASGLAHAESVQRLKVRLESQNLVKVTYDWTTHGEVAEHQRRWTACKEIKAVQRADAVILYLPGGRGAHVELGAALALGKWVILLATEEDEVGSSGRPCAFYRHPKVLTARTFEECVTLLKELREWG